MIQILVGEYVGSPEAEITVKDADSLFFAAFLLSENSKVYQVWDKCWMNQEAYGFGDLSGWRTAPEVEERLHNAIKKINSSN